MRKFRFLVLVSVLLVFISIQIISGTRLQTETAQPYNTLSAFDATDLSGKDWNQNTLKNKVILIDFWATWCGPCTEQIPYLKKLYKDYHPHGFEILAISIDTEGRLELERFRRRYQIPWPQFADFRGYSGKIPTQFGVQSIPASFLYNRSGELVGINLDHQTLRKHLEHLCQEPAPQQYFSR